jgi:hypothetical protein
MSLVPTTHFRWLQYKNAPTPSQLEERYSRGDVTRAQAMRELVNATSPVLQQKFLEHGVTPVWIDIPVVVLPHDC